VQLFIFVLAFYFLFILLKVLQNHNKIQANQEIPYQSNTDSLLNIVQSIRQSKPL
jgi:hypothetical protein